jgi:hypothetical protein
MEKIFNFVKTILGFVKETNIKTKSTISEVPKIVETFNKIEELIIEKPVVEEPIIEKPFEPQIVEKTKASSKKSKKKYYIKK